MRTVTALLALALVLPAAAQKGPLKGLSVRAGLFQGFEFDGFNPARIKLRGPSLGVDFPLSEQAYTGSKQSLSLTGVFAGAQQSGSDSDADVYRLMLTNRNRIKGLGVYVIAGYGYGEARPRGGTDFGDRKQWIRQYGVGKMLSKFDTLGDFTGAYGDLAKGIAPFVEVSYIDGGRPFRGWQFELGVRF